MGRLSLLVTSPRVAPGLLSRSAWYAVESASARLCRDLSEPVVDAIVESGLTVDAVGPEPTAPDLARLLVSHSVDSDVVWLGSSDADPGLTDAIASEVSRLEVPPEVEVIVGSWDVPGSRLLDAVAVMDRLRSPGGCPWDAKQTHESLAKYLTEEAGEAVEAIGSGDRQHLAEELGDVLLQVLFHSRVAEDADSAEDQFDIDDVAGVLVDKLVRRHPHVFADGDASTPEEVEAEWARIKAAGEGRQAGSLNSAFPVVGAWDAEANAPQEAAMTAQIPQVPQSSPVPQGSPVPAGSSSRTQSTWALGLSIAALAISCVVAALLAAQFFLGWGLQQQGWFAYAPDGVDAREPSPLLNEGVVLVDAEGGVAGEAIAGSVLRALDPGSRPLVCQDVPLVVADATSVCTWEDEPGLKVVVLFVNDRGRFVWSQVTVDPGAYPPPQ